MNEQILAFFQQHPVPVIASGALLVISHFFCFLADHRAAFSRVSRILRSTANVIDLSGKLAEDVRDRKLEDALDQVRNLSDELKELRQQMLDPTAKGPSA